MNRRHLLWHVFNHLEECDIDISDIIESLAINNVRFNDPPQPGEMTVAENLRERYDAYKKDRMNG